MGTMDQFKDKGEQLSEQSKEKIAREKRERGRSPQAPGERGKRERGSHMPEEEPSRRMPRESGEERFDRDEYDV
ncbi:hypothetical protein ACWD4J_26995 [Streptomyces sp. NPDC002577]